MKLEKIRLDQTHRAQTLEEEARDAEQKVKRSSLLSQFPCNVTLAYGACYAEVMHLRAASSESPQDRFRATSS